VIDRLAGGAQVVRLVPSTASPKLGAAAEATIRLQALPPLSLYIHVPWCLRKCPYCDFNSHERSAAQAAELPDESLHGQYVDALVLDLEAALPAIWGRRVETVFIGGGTPSLLSPAMIDRLIAAVRARVPMAPMAEITMEANPGTFERDRFAGYRRAGVTRLSIGVQSFDDASLQALGRVHDAAQARAAVSEARDVFETFNLDLMYALPKQSVAALRQDVATALSFQPPHLSVYHLTLEPNTYFHGHPPPDLPDADAASDMLDTIVALTQAQGMDRYEVSAFARQGQRCAHNLNYWRFGDYLGLGAGAHSKLSFPDRIERQTRWREPSMYLTHTLQGQAVSNVERLRADALPFEFMLNALRLQEGVPLSLLAERTGQSWVQVEATLQHAVQRGLLMPFEPSLPGVTPATPGRLAATAKGFDFLTDLQSMFLPTA
jgi:putative oxygen-independent coproporphyrinogen III oxidase